MTQIVASVRRQAQLEDDFLKEIRQYVVKDDAYETVIELPDGIRFIPNYSLIGNYKRYKRFKYGISTRTGHTKRITLFKNP